MTLKHALLAGVAGLALSAACSIPGPALAHQVWRIASNDNLTVDERVALVDSWRWQWKYDAARMVSMDRFTRAGLLGQNVVDRNGRTLGRIVNDARYVNGDLAGVEIALGGDRALWIRTPDLRYYATDGILFTHLSPQQSADRARLASNNPYPAS